MALSRDVRVGAAGFAFTGHTQFDGYDPLTFEHTDTLDNTRNRLAAGRIWGEAGGSASAWSGRAGVSLLDSSNRNFLASEPLNRTSGLRRTLEPLRPPFSEPVLSLRDPMPAVHQIYGAIRSAR